MPLGVAQDLRGKHGFCHFLGSHFSCRFLLGHDGEPMKQAWSAVDLLSVVNRYGTDDRCRAYLTELRWAGKVICPKCLSDSISRVQKRNIFDCNSCRYQFSVLSGTMFHDTHLPLTKWFYATYLFCECREGMSANQLKRMLPTSYETAWYLCHRIRAAMAAGDDRPKLGGTAKVDRTFIGGKQRGHQHKMRRPECKKQVVIGIRQRGGEPLFFHPEDVKSGTLAKYIRENISQDVDVIMCEHKALKHQDGVYAVGDVYTNTVESGFSLSKRGIVGSWHRVSVKHLQAYLDEMCFRFDNRENPYLFRDLLIKMLESGHVEYKYLTARNAA
jgi:transposase-like protein